MQTSLNWAPNREDMIALADKHREQFLTAQPFSHVVIDNFLPAEIVADLIASFPGPEDAVWGSFNDKRQIKLALNDEAQMPPPIRHMIQQLNSQVAVEFLERLTGIEGLVPDPHLYGGGLHQIRPGGVLKVHADFDMHPSLHLHRRLNAILYLNPDWEEAYGGALQLWNLDMTEAVRVVYPVANRLVIFATTDTSWHGHPDPLSCPPDRTRRSMAWYYYTAPADRRDGHSTLFQARPGERIRTPIERVKDVLRPFRDRIRNR